MARQSNTEFEFRGVNHIALVCRDMAQTVRFYRDILGMPLVKTLDLPMGQGQHFFFDVGNGDCIAFFWFPNAPEKAPGIASPEALPGLGNFHTAHGSLNHLAFNVPSDKFDDYCRRLEEKGITLTPVLNHDNSPLQLSAEVYDDVFIRSVYFFDPDGICLEFACWNYELGERDVSHDPVRADGTKDVGLVTASSH